MKRSRYISFLLLLLFVVAVGCRVSVSFMCSCHHHHEHGHVHVCCKSADHAIDCGHHDQVFKDHCCNFHFSVEELAAQLPSDDSKVNKSLSAEPLTLMFVSALLYNLFDQEAGDQTNNVDYYLFYATSGGGLSTSLRAPPVLV